MMQKIKQISFYFILSWVLLQIPTFDIFAQGNIGITAAAKVDTNAIELGDQATITLKVRTPEDYFKNGNTLNWHSFKDTLIKALEVVEFSAIDTSLSTDGKTKILEQKIIITSFDTGFHVIPPFQFQRNSDTSKFVETQPILFQVKEVEISENEEDIADIKGPLDQAITLMEILTYVGIALIILVLAFLVYKYLKNRKPTEKPVPAAPFIPERPYHEIALERLEKLQNSDYLSKGDWKSFHAELSLILRFYLGRRYDILAVEQTTDEILKSLKSRPLSAKQKEELQFILELSDLVKFAKNIPLEDDNKIAIQKAINFVKETKLEEQTPTKEVEGGKENDQ